MDRPSSEKSSGTTSQVSITDGDQDWDPKVDAQASGLEAAEGHAKSRFDEPVLSGRRLNPVEDLKRRLSEWGESSVHRGLDEEEEGSEYELLLDPNLPDEYSSRLQSFDRDSTSFDDEVAMKRTEEEED